jgi:hypothetical protein
VRKVTDSKHHLSSKNHLISKAAISKQRLYARVFPSKLTFITKLTIQYHPKPTFYPGTDPIFIIYSITSPGFTASRAYRAYRYGSCRDDDDDGTVGDGGDNQVGTAAEIPIASEQRSKRNWK